MGNRVLTEPQFRLMAGHGDTLASAESACSQAAVSSSMALCSQIT
jgi:hypothetical protein